MTIASRLSGIALERRMTYADHLEDARLAVLLLLRNRPLAAQRIAYHPHEARYLQRIGMWNADRMFVLGQLPLQ